MQLYCTRKGAERLRERERTVTLKLKEIQKGKGDAATRGSTHDNAEFEELVRQEHMMNSQLREVRETINKLVVIDAIPPDCENLRIGHLADLTVDGEQKTVRIVGYEESDLEATPQAMSYLAPLITRFIGKPPGTEMDLQIGGRMRHVVLEGVRRPEVRNGLDLER